MANDLSEDDLKKGTDDGPKGVEEETPVATARKETLVKRLGWFKPEFKIA